MELTFGRLLFFILEEQRFNVVGSPSDRVSFFRGRRVERIKPDMPVPEPSSRTVLFENSVFKGMDGMEDEAFQEWIEGFVRRFTKEREPDQIVRPVSSMPEERERMEEGGREGRLRRVSPEIVEVG